MSATPSVRGSPTAETKPEPSSEKPNIISLTVKAQDGSETTFRLKRHNKLGKLIKSYCQANSVSDPRSIRFLFDGTRINDEDTPETLEMENDDRIDVMVEQLGGAFY